MLDKFHPLRWGILGAGHISETFIKDLLVDPRARDVTDIAHQVVAVGSRSAQKAEEFIKRIEGLDEKVVKAHGTYQELVLDDKVDVIYIGTPHPFHYPDVKLALNAGKHVLCEKPMTVNALQARDLFQLAKEKKCFLMEALWTRFFPITQTFQKVLASGEIGEIQRVDADFSFNFDCDSLPSEHRLVNPELGGGALLDLGPYAWTMLALTLLHQHIKPKGSPFWDGKEPTIDPDLTKSILPLMKIQPSGALYKHPEAKLPQHVDGSVLATLEFPTPSGKTAQGLFVASMLQTTHKERSVTVYGTKGRIRIPSPSCRPLEFGVTILKKASQDPNWKWGDDLDAPEKIYSAQVPGHARGYYWEADEVARCLKSGLLESDRMPHSETLLMMEVFDEIRKQIGVEYPKSLELL